jgi:hypothetical protein
VVKIRDDCAEHPEAPKVVLARERSWNASHQEKPGNLGWRCPGPDATFGFTVEQLFARPVISPGSGNLQKGRLWLEYWRHVRFRLSERCS